MTFLNESLLKADYAVSEMVILDIRRVHQYSNVNENEVNYHRASVSDITKHTTLLLGVHGCLTCLKVR